MILKRRYNCFGAFGALLIALLMFPSSVGAEYKVRQITNMDGLPNNSVNSFCEDSRSNIWIGTWDGLCQFNGRDFRVFRFDRNNPKSIANNVIHQIIEQDSNNIWVCTNASVSRWNHSKQLFDNYIPGGARQILMSPYRIVLTPSGKIICCLLKEGYWYFDEISGEFRTMTGDGDPSIVKLEIDQNGFLYTLTNNKEIIRYKIDGTTLTQKTLLSTSSRVNDISLSGDKMAIIYGSSVEILNLENLQSRVVFRAENRTIARTILQDDDLLIAFTRSGGYAKYNLKNRELTNIESPHSHTSFFSIYAGSQNITWVGTDGQGVLQLYNYISPFQTFKSNYPVRCFSQNDNNRIFAGTKGEGVIVFDKRTKKQIKTLTVANGLLSNSVYCMRKNSYGDIFIGTEGRGVNILTREGDIEKLMFSTINDQIKSIYSIAFSHGDSIVWLGTSGYGLIKVEVVRDGNKYLAKNVTQYTSGSAPYSIRSNTIFSILLDDDPNILWFGTRSGGVNRLDIKNERFERVGETEQSVDFSDIIFLVRSDAETLWVGSSYGLAKINTRTRKISNDEFSKNEMITNSAIHGVISDINGNLWVSTNNGLSRIDSQTKRVVNYTSQNGLQDNEFSDGAYFTDSENTIFFGGIGGFNYFNADEIELRTFDPEIQLSTLKINNQEQNIHDRIRDNVLKLSYGESFVNFSFAVGEFINNENCVYNYRIVGFAEQWIYNDDNPNVSITRLRPGKYRLEVEYTNGDRVWSEKIYTLNLKVGYPWWLGGWAFFWYIVMAAVTTYIIYSVIKSRIRLSRQVFLQRIEEKNQRRKHLSQLDFFTNVAHEFFTPLTLIYTPAQHLLDSRSLDGFSKRYLTMIKNNAERIQKLLSELMEFRKIESGHTPLQFQNINMQQMLDYVSDDFIEIAGENKIDFNVYSENLSYFITDRNALEKILLNLISNTFKHTPQGGYIELHLNQTDNQLNILTRNSGKGLSEQQILEIFDRFRIFEASEHRNAISNGIGLNLTRQLVKLLGGTITVESELGKYVEFVVKLPSMPIVQPEERVEPTRFHNLEMVTRSKDISILVVDDEKDIRQLLVDILSPHYNVSEASDGEQAMSAISDNIPDIVLTDIMMPKMGGIELISQLKKNKSTAHIPVISISAKSSIEDRIEAVEYGADAYIAKPFHPRHVLVTVGQIISKHSTLRKYFRSSRSAISVRDGVKFYSEDKQLLDDIIVFIENNIDDESLTPNSIANFLGMSKTSLFDKLKMLTGKTPGEYVRSIRLEHASKLLKTTKLTVSEIMYKSGFMSKSFFYKEFSRQFGLSPSEYRKSEE